MIRKNGSFGSRGKRGSHPAGTDGFFFCASNYNGKKCAKNKKEDVWASLKEKAGVKDGEHTQIA